MDKFLCMWVNLWDLRSQNSLQTSGLKYSLRNGV